MNRFCHKSEKKSELSWTILFRQAKIKLNFLSTSNFDLPSDKDDITTNFLKVSRTQHKTVPARRSSLLSWPQFLRRGKEQNVFCSMSRSNLLHLAVSCLLNKKLILPAANLHISWGSTDSLDRQDLDFVLSRVWHPGMDARCVHIHSMTCENQVSLFSANLITSQTPKWHTFGGSQVGGCMPHHAKRAAQM